MVKHNQEGAVNGLLVSLILASVALLAAIGFGGWAFSSRQDYKNNVDQKISLAVTSAVAEEGIRKDKAFAEASKNPLKTYTGPEEYGTVSMQYPKTWSAYVNAVGNEGLNGFFNRDVVPSTEDQNSTFALRLEVVDQAYDETLREFDSNEEVTVAPYALPKQPKIIGVKVTGQIEEEKQGTMVIIPVRDKTLKVYTTASEFTGDYNNIILPNLTFSP